jgi:hypothetical protein
MKQIGLIIVILSVSALTGCIYVNDTEDGRRDREYRSRTEPTVGQELLDLDRARANGVISDAEYERAKSAILDDIK